MSDGEILLMSAPKSEVVDINHQSDAFQLLKEDLQVQVKENLNISRVRDTEVTITVRVQTETFMQFIQTVEGEAAEIRRGVQIYRANWKSIAKCLGDDWHFRIVNKAGDFAYVVEETIQFWMNERRSLEEYVRVGDTFVKRLIHRGHTLSFRFVKNRGNRHELHQIGM